MSLRTIMVAMLAGLLALAGCAPAGQAGASTGQSADELTLYIVRHGRTMLNTSDRVQGWSDAVLTPEGEQVVRAAGRGMKGIAFQGAYSSDSGRARQTAQLILRESVASKGLTLQEDPRLREFNFGTWEGDLNDHMWTAAAQRLGKSKEEFLKTLTPQQFADTVAALDKENPEAAKNWLAEDYTTITTRLTAALDEIVKREKEKGSGNVLVVSHGLSISALLATLFPDFRMPEGGLKNASVTVVKVKGTTYTLEKINDLSYVEAGR